MGTYRVGLSGVYSDREQRINLRGNGHCSTAMNNTACPGRQTITVNGTNS
jgi:hypothetical protein